MSRSFFFSSRRRHTRSVSAFLLNRSSDLEMRLRLGKVTVADVLAAQPVTTNLLKFMRASIKMIGVSRSEERFSRNAETDLVCRLLLEKKKKIKKEAAFIYAYIVSVTHSYYTTEELHNHDDEH